MMEETVSRQQTDTAEHEPHEVPEMDVPDNGAGDATDLSSFAALLDQYEFNVPRRGDILTGEVLSAFDNAIVLDVGAKRDAIVPSSDLARLDNAWLAKIQVGDELPVYVVGTPHDEEELVVSLARGLESLDWNQAEVDMETGVIMELPVVNLNRGGILVQYRQLRGFVPNSHVSSLRYIRNTEERDRLKQELEGETLPLKIIEVDRERRRLVMSALEAEKERRKERLNELTEGEIVRGVVENLTDFGAFVNLGGVSGLIHVSKLDWRRVNHPSEVLQAGDEVEVLIEQVDTERERISLNRQAVLPNPWEMASNTYSIGDELEGVVTNVVDFGAFVRVPAGVEGLVHVSEMPTFVTDKPSEIVQRGETVKVRVLSIDPRRERLALSMLPAEPEVELTWDVADEAPEEMTDEAPADSAEAEFDSTEGVQEETE
jgi:small subunit ribosomal protein S1